MAETKTESTKPAVKRTSTAKRTTTRKVEANTERVERTVEKKPETKKRRTFQHDEYVTVRNGFQGKLVYKSSRTGEKYVFEKFGDEHEMEIQELKKARNDSKKFFESNWFLIDDPEVIDYIGVREYYKDALTYDEFDKLQDMTAEEISERLSNVSEGQKISIAHHARALVKEGKIDSIKAITVLEKCLGVGLVDH